MLLRGSAGRTSAPVYVTGPGVNVAVSSGIANDHGRSRVRRLSRLSCGDFEPAVSRIVHRRLDDGERKGFLPRCRQLIGLI